VVTHGTINVPGLDIDFIGEQLGGTPWLAQFGKKSTSVKPSENAPKNGLTFAMKSAPSQIIGLWGVAPIPESAIRVVAEFGAND
jgi:hypothetical protein